MTALSPGWLHNDTIFRLDHNSVMLPIRDVASPHLGSEPPDTVKARVAEAEFVSSHHVMDAYWALHEGRLDDLPLEGYTCGFPRLSQAPSQPDISPNESAVLPDRRRHIDRILLPSSYLQNLLDCYCTFLGGSDHKVVVARIAPLKRHANKLKRCPTTFLSYAVTVSAVGEKLEAIPTEG